MKVVVVGSGGREHALAEAFARHAHEVCVSPGNDGMPWSTAVPATDLAADLFVIGPEAPLIAGLADELRAQGKVVFGPSQHAAQLEGSKVFMKQLLDAAGVPTASWKLAHARLSRRRVTSMVNHFYLISRGCIVKTDGPAAGKGVAVFGTDLEHRFNAAQDAWRKLHDVEHNPSREVVIEELLIGTEASLEAIVSGTDYVLLPGARDYKRLLDGDQGPNTGGMGGYSPHGSDEDVRMWAKVCLEPLLAELSQRGIDYRGAMKIDLMLTEAGPQVLEVNVRLGDPETQSIMPRITSDLAELLLAAARAQPLPTLEVSSYAAVTVVLTTSGYPERATVGQVIAPSREVLTRVDARHHIYCAGVRLDENGTDLLTSGGRVLAVTALGGTRELARERAYARVRHITWLGCQYRKDIAAD